MREPPAWRFRYVATYDGGTDSHHGAEPEGRTPPISGWQLVDQQQCRQGREDTADRPEVHYGRVGLSPMPTRKEFVDRGINRRVFRSDTDRGHEAKHHERRVIPGEGGEKREC